MKKVAAIDIGSNSIKLILVNINPTGSFIVLKGLKETVRLGKDMSSTGALHPEKIEMAVAALFRFKNFCTSEHADEIIVVATEAVRRASNRHVFLNRVKDVLDMNIRILSGEEEAYYDYLSVVNSTDFSNGLIMDIGGRSTELIWVKDKKLNTSISIPLGAISLTENFNLSENINSENEEELRSFLEQTYKKIPWLTEVKGQTFMGIGGTVRSLRQISREDNDCPLDTSNPYSLTYSEVVAIYDLVKNKNTEERKSIKGLAKNRADIFLGAAAAIEVIMHLYHLPTLYATKGGVREGLIYEYLSR